MQAPHIAPLVPHWLSVIVVTQVPVESQHPFVQLVAVQLSTQLPPAQVCALEHVLHDPPPVPQVVADSCVWHCPSIPQHPVAHVALPQVTDPELLPDPELPLDPEPLPDAELPLDPEPLPDAELPLDPEPLLDAELPLEPEPLPDPELPLEPELLLAIAPEPPVLPLAPDPEAPALPLLDPDPEPLPPPPLDPEPELPALPSLSPASAWSPIPKTDSHPTPASATVPRSPTRRKTLITKPISPERHPAQVPRARSARPPTAAPP